MIQCSCTHLSIQGRLRAQKRKWAPRKRQEYAAWNALMEPLTNAYLDWKHSTDVPEGGTEPRRSASPEESTDLPKDPAPMDVCQDVPPGANTSTPEDPTPTDAHQEAQSVVYPYTVDLYDIFSRKRQVTVFRDPQSISPALDLLRHGYLAKTPGRPTVAVAIETLELLHRLRLRCPSLSVEAFARTVLDYYSVRSQARPPYACLRGDQIPYRKYLRTLFADTFELYILIIRNVEQRVLKKLGWDGPDWRPLNACRACCYKVRPITITSTVAID